MHEYDCVRVCSWKGGCAWCGHVQEHVREEVENKISFQVKQSHFLLLMYVLASDINPRIESDENVQQKKTVQHDVEIQPVETRE